MQRRDQDSLFTPAPLPVAALDDGERLACLRLIRSENVGPVTFRDAINHFGGASRALEALPELSRRGGRGRPIRICPLADAEAELAAAVRIGARPVFTIEPGYPAILAAIEAPPPLLYIKGRAELLVRPAVAIVGSRQCSAAGAKLARLFAHDLAEAGYTIVSGLARGIDRVAHEASIAHGTVAVLAGGLDNIYPPEHAALHAQIGTEGVLASERPPGFQPRDKDFPRRNRIIAGLASGVVIIEAAARSGTLVTARYANEHGREVFAVPGHPLDPRAEGTNRLIKAGATLVTCPDDVRAALSLFSGIEEAARRSGPAISASAARPEPMPDVGARECDLVLSALGPMPVDLDAVVRVTGLAIREVQIAIMELELAGRVVRPGSGLVARVMG